MGKERVARSAASVLAELLAAADVDGHDAVGEADLLEEDRDFPAIRRGPVVEIDHAERMSSPPGRVQGVALVTGGSRGLGRELARVLLARGFAVAIVARGREALAAAERELARGAPGPVASWPCDVGDPAQCRSAVERVVETFGRLDLLANCAG